MVNFKSRDIIKALQKKGFVKKESHHHLFCFVYHGKLTQIKTKVSHGSKVVSDWVVCAMRRQLYLDGTQFTNLINCPLSQADLEEIYINQGKITRYALQTR